MRFVVVVVALVLVAGCGDDGASSSAAAPVEEAAEVEAPADAGASPADAAAPVSYPDSKEGLEQLMTDLLAALEAGNQKRALYLADSLELLDYQAWFTATFGKPIGDALSAEYEPMTGRFDQLLPVLADLRERGHTKIVVERFRSLTDKDAVVYQNQALRAMRRTVPLYSVRLVDPSNDDASGTFHLWSFIHHDGSFRWVGKLKRATSSKAAGDDAGEAGDRRELRVRDVEALDRLLAR